MTVPNIRHAASRIGAVLCLALLTACGPASIHANVLRFNEMAAAPKGGNFAIQPDADQQGGLEFRSYADLVSQSLERMGYHRVADPAKAEMVVSLFYSVDDGRTEVWTTPIYSYNDYWRRYYGVQSAWPFRYNEPLGVDTHSSTIFSHRLELTIVDGAKLRHGHKETLFEGRAVTERSTRELVTTIPYLITAMFEDFPGQNGVPVSVRVPERLRPSPTLR